MPTTTAVPGGPTPLRRPPLPATTPDEAIACSLIAIQQLQYRYAHVLDGDASDAAHGVASLFSEDAVLYAAYSNEDPICGRENIEKWFDRYLLASRTTSALRRHIVTVNRIDIRGDRAWGFSYLDAQGYQLAGNKIDFYAGAYEDDFIRMHDRWYFRTRRITLDYQWSTDMCGLARNGRQALNGDAER